MVGVGYGARADGNAALIPVLAGYRRLGTVVGMVGCAAEAIGEAAAIAIARFELNRAGPRNTGKRPFSRPLS